jgi:hypothetical protein
MAQAHVIQTERCCAQQLARGYQDVSSGGRGVVESLDARCHGRLI